ncbi:hypothetical protein A7U60_g2862 [Sanghuangporus baumii]|uniref:BHLH domain-containing protein n=1 Tax=Sanghuangporus baumii TaxID=108892 RepID=A0A9Q5I1E3_SANBA|nr:hypothetical protein A7U60_g2862 [Sanghuangporus baumii]
MATMPLLSLAESIKFDSALLNYSNGIGAPEWTMYTADPSTEELDDRHLPPHREGSEQLAKATKDLISLDCSSLRWNESADRDVLTSALPATSPQSLHFKPPFQSTSYAFPSPLHRFSSPLQQIFGAPQSPLPLTTVAPSHTLDSSAASDSQQSASSVSSDPTPPPPTPPSLKRPYTSSSDLSSMAGPSSSSNASASSSRQQGKKHRALPPHQQGPVLNAKPILLSASQKKANHIQSEQKRRANIRRGYEALCETVPALREAIAAEERELADSAPDSENGLRGKPKKNRGKRAMSESGEKIDGRAGPRSENVVLQKTIDYIHELLEDRKVLLDRLNRARSKLSSGHPALVTLQDVCLWEREWTGGTGITDDGDSDDEDEP